MKKHILFLVLILAVITSATAQQNNSLTAVAYDDSADDKVMLVFDACKGKKFSAIEFQYSTDGINFTTIHQVVYKKDSNATAHLSYLHSINYIGKVYYRVTSGNINLSETVPFDLNKLYSSVKVVPNPASVNAVISFNNRYNYSCSVRIVNSVGCEALLLTHFSGNKINVDAAGLKPGMYRFVIQSDNGELFFDGTLLVAH